MSITTVAFLLLAVTFFTAGAASEREVEASMHARRGAGARGSRRLRCIPGGSR